MLGRARIKTTRTTKPKATARTLGKRGKYGATFRLKRMKKRFGLSTVLLENG